MKAVFSILLLFILLFSFTSCSTDDVVDNDDVNTDTIQEKIDGSINWKNWYLSVPLNNGEGKATSIFYADIVNKNLSDEASEYFYQNADSSYTMFTKFTGYTTSGEYALNDGKYCRTELREFWRGLQTTSDNWKMDSGTHILESTLNVDYVENNKSVIVAQIHGKESVGVSGNPATVKVFWSRGFIKVYHYTKPDIGEPWSKAFENRSIIAGQVDSNIFTIKIKVEKGKLYYGLYCKANEIDIDYTFAYDYASNGYVHDNYFKTGNYFLNDDNYTSTSQVKLYKVITEHY